MDNQDFEKYADTKVFNDSINPVWDRLFKSFLRQNKKSPAELKILDYGCGDGKFLHFYTAHGFGEGNVYGHEVSEKRVRRCQEKGWKNVFYTPMNMALPFPDNEFDFVNMAEVIEHIPADKIDFYLQDIQRMMKDDAVMFISTPNYPIKRWNDWFNVVVNRKWSRMKDDPTHVAFYTPQLLRARLQKFFPQVNVVCYRAGVFYPRIKHPAFMHKIIAVCSKNTDVMALTQDEISALIKAA